MQSLWFVSETSSDGVVERDFVVGDVPGVLWSPVAGVPNAPLVLMGHGGGLHKKTPAQLARARDMVTTWGFNVVAIDAPGHGERPRTAADDEARDGMRQAMAAGDIARIPTASVPRPMPLAGRAAPEWPATPDPPHDRAEQR